MLAYNYPLGGVFLSMLYFFLFFIWIWILFTVFIDIFRSHDLSGWLKALWTIFVIILPFLGCFIYLIARGGKDAGAQDPRGHPAEAGVRRLRPRGCRELGWRCHLSARQAGRPQGTGVLTDAEFEAQKAKVLAAG